MATNHYTILTDVGAAKIANAIRLGEKIEVTELAVGDGGGKLPMPGSSATALVNEWRRAPINTSFVDDQNEAWVVFEQVLPPDVGGHYIREIGLYDAAGDLIAIGNYPEQYKPLLAEGASTTQTVRVVIQVLSSSAVTLKVDPSTVLATRSYVDKKLEAHEKSRNHPYATTTLPGMTELATGTEAKNRTDKTRVLTPDTGGQMLAEHERASTAHNAAQIALEKLIDTFGDAKTVQAVLAMLGDAARKTVGEAKGNVMLVEAFGLGATSAVDRDITGEPLPTGFYNSTSFSGGSFYAAAGAIVQARRASDRAFALYGICNDTDDARVYAMKQNSRGWVQNEFVTTASMGLVFTMGSNSAGQYIKFASGVMIAWGTGSSQGLWTSFPATFNGNPSVQATPSFSVGEFRTAVVYDRGPTGFRSQAFGQDGGKSGVGQDWTATGFWK